MKLRSAATVAIAILLAGCGGLGHLGAPDKLTEIRYDYIYSTEVFERHMLVSPAGDVQVSQRTGTGDRDVQYARAHLSAAQTQALLQAFRDWDQLNTTYPVFFRGPVIDITFAGKKVTSAGGETAPDIFKQAQAALDAVADSALAAAAGRAPTTSSPASPGTR